MLYVYTCDECEKFFEMLIPLKDFEETEEIECPKCGKKIRRIMCPVQFKIEV